MVEQSVPPTPTTRDIATRTAVVIGGTALAFNAAFYFLSQLYFDSHKIYTPGVGEFVDSSALGKARVAFGILSLLVAASAFAASLAPRLIGHALAVTLGLAALFAGYESFDHGLPTVMTAVLVAVGVLLPTLAHFSWRHSRAAWSYLIAIATVMGIVTFFGAPKVRNVLDVGFWTAMILPGLMFVMVTALSMVRGEYRATA
ncbi:MAG: hypothetical protein JO257_09345 [Deltaproteobacteria bacterium]|nr:hypothetical protein [Deltaproteobacteria bacterium]